MSGETRFSHFAHLKLCKQDEMSLGNEVSENTYQSTCHKEFLENPTEKMGRKKET